MTHTPGEWTAEGKHIIARDNAGLVNNDGNSIAILYGPDRTDNAALITAAPGLLEACKAALYRFGSYDSDYTAMNLTMEKLRTIITKAEGDR